MIRAVRYKQSDIAALLINKGAEVSGVYDSNGFSVLAIACTVKDLKMVQMVLAAGVDVNEPLTKEEYTALHVSARESTVEIVQLLIDNGADVDCFDGDGHLASDFASDHSIIKLLESRQKRKVPAQKSSWCEYSLEPFVAVMNFLNLCCKAR